MSDIPPGKEKHADKLNASSEKSISLGTSSSIPLEPNDQNDRKVKDAYYGSDQHNVFSTPGSLSYWTDVYDKSKYEGRHRFDPQLQWSPSEEKRLLRKLDLRIMVWVWIMFSSLDLIRRNINRAVSDKLLPELGMNTNDFNNGQTIYFLTFLAMEVPGGLISKKIGPDIMTPIAIISWGTICACQSLITNRTGYYVTRAVLGLAQGGFIPEMVLYLSYFYKSNELPTRISIFYTVIPISQIIGSLLAAGFLEMRGLSNWSGWRWLFLIEGIMSIVVGILSFIFMPASVTQTGNILRGKVQWLHGKTGWFTAREEGILVNRILRDDPSKGDMNNRQHVNFRGLYNALRDVDLWPIYVLGVLAFLPFQPTANYLSLTLSTLNYTAFQSNMLAIPGFVLFALNVLFIVWLSQKVNERLIVSAWSNIWMLPFFIGIVAIPKSASYWVRYALLTGINGIPYNYNGNKILLGICCANIVLFGIAKLYYIKRNQMKKKAWSKLTEDEKIHYAATTEDTGMRRLNVVFAH